MAERYELVRLIGRGAAGDVYLARDRLLEGRELALKRIRARVDEPLREAFEREFSTMASLSVPGVAPVYDFGVMPGEPGEPDRPFYTRAYIEGRPLDEAAKVLPVPERAALFARVCRVIAPLHRMRVVHGDIKPGNVIIDANGEAHVIDFGLARIAGAGKAAGGSGTPPFMAPELLQGQPPSVASDGFALGATLWLLLTGDAPFTSTGQRARAGRHSEPPRLPAQLDRQSEALLEVSRRALAGDPLDRFPTVEELLAALEEACPAARVERGRVFAAPRPRGHSDLLGRLQALATAPGVADGGRCLLVTAKPGGGKSLVLRELKWRLQLRALQVVDLALGGLNGGAQVATLFSQLRALSRPDSAVFANLERALAAIGSQRFDELELADVLASSFAALSEHGGVVLLVDDLDRAEASYGAVLRSAVFADCAGAITLVATASDADAPAVRALGPATALELAALSHEDVRALSAEVLGAVDSSVLDALVARVDGSPGALMGALASLCSSTAPTPADVEALEPAAAAMAQARARLDALPAEGVALLGVFSLLGRAHAERWLERAPAWLCTPCREVTQLVARAERFAVLNRRAEGLGLADAATEQALRERLGEELPALARRLLHDEALCQALPLSERVRLALVAGDRERLRALAPPAVERLLLAGAPAAAAPLCEAWLEVVQDSDRGHAWLWVARTCQALGDDERAAELARQAADCEQLADELRGEAAVLAARALTALGRFDEAVQTLDGVSAVVEPSAQARRFHELGRIHLRRGDYSALAEAAQAGLLVAPADATVRAELLCSLGMAASYRADHEQARRCHEEALALARRLGSARDEANALAYLAIGHFRTGDALSARDMFAQCLEIARRIGDIGSMANYSLNLGAMLFYLGEPQAAAEHYESAARLARRAGRASTDLFARNNLAHVHIYFGLYERARSEVAQVLQAARVAGQKYNEAQAIVLMGDLAARSEDVERALIHYDDGIARYAALGQMREVADHHLDAAEVLLDRGGPSDASAAVARLSAAREPIEREALVDLKLRHALLLSRARVASGDAEGALEGLHAVLAQARKEQNRDVEWTALSAASLAHEALGADFAARRHARMAAEVLEDIALRVPREHRDAFWHDPRRRAARSRALSADESSHGGPLSGEPVSLLGDPRAERLLEIIKRLASEHDLDRLLERITESAVDLSGAERGYVLLVDGEGQLEKRTMQVSKSGQPDAHDAFSRSIAEAVLIDGEPIVTVDAARDGRLSEYVSVHKLMLRSVACLPIRSPSGTVGVLYLEHRRSRGRFSESAVDLLHAFADQAAIALENARLMLEIKRRQAELEEANRELEAAKRGVEELLHARTEELAEAQRELKRTRRSRRDAHTRHGMVGQSAKMRRVFEAIDRLQSVRVPVVIYGESGTGKELVARAMHYGGERARAPFVAINCGSLPENLLESELFGHVKGAFSGADRERGGMIARASGGTLFLDEVGDMPPRMQVDLLRVLQEGTVCKVGGDQEERVDVRVLAASNRRLADLVQQGQFREDLYYRLNVVEVVLPPLRERRDDIPLLCQHLLASFAEREQTPEKRLTREALERLMSHPLPGNVRQLEHILLQAMVLVPGPTIDVIDLALTAPGESERAPAAPVEQETAPAAPRNLADHRDLERKRIIEALELHNWNRARAARELGMPRRTFYRRLREYSVLAQEG